MAHRLAFAQRLAVGRRLRAGDDVEHASGQARARGQLRGGQGRQRRELRGLDDHGAARRQRRGHLARDHGQRKVPGRDGRAHANGLAHDQQALAGRGRGGHFAAGAPGLLGKPLHEAGAVGHLAQRLGQRLALLGGHDAGQVLLVLHEQLKPAQQRRVPRFARERAPGGPGRFGGGNGLAHLRGRHIRHVGQMPPRGRVRDRKAALARAPLAVDKSIGFQQGRVLKLGKGHGGFLPEKARGQGKRQEWPGL